MSSQGYRRGSDNATGLGLTFENFTLDHSESVNREPPECLRNDQLQSRTFSVRKPDDHKSHRQTCVIAEACAQFLRYPNRVVVHVSVRSSLKCSIDFFDILDIAITRTAVNLYALDTLSKRRNTHLYETSMRSQRPRPRTGIHSSQETQRVTPYCMSVPFSDQSQSYTKPLIGCRHIVSRQESKCARRER